MASPETATPNKQSLLKRAVAAAAIGNCTEWYDFGLYAYVATYVASQFFPEGNAALNIVLVFALFAISFLVRPFGSLVFGPLGDRIGRQKVLAVTILIMSGSTFLIGLLPTWQQVGVLAPILLLLLRLVQGFSTGGEYGGAATYIAEFAPAKRRGFYGSWLEFGTLVGFGLGAGVPTILILTTSEPFMNDWGWRIPFLIAGPLGAVGLYLRKKLEDTPAFKELHVPEVEGGSRVATIVKDLRALVAGHWQKLLILMGIVITINVGNYTLLTYLETHLKENLQLTSELALGAVIAMTVMMLIIITPIGALSDKVGRKPIFLSACICYIVFTYPAFLLIENGTTVSVLAGMGLLGLCHVQLIGPLAATLPAMFPTGVRYSAFSVGYNVSTAIFGGTAASVNQLMVGVTGDALFPAYYLIGAAVIGIIPVLLMKETAGKPIDQVGLEEKPLKSAVVA